MSKKNLSIIFGIIVFGLIIFDRCQDENHDKHIKELNDKIQDSEHIIKTYRLELKTKFREIDTLEAKLEEEKIPEQQAEQTIKQIDHETNNAIRLLPTLSADSHLVIFSRYTIDLARIRYGGDSTSLSDQGG